MVEGAFRCSCVLTAVVGCCFLPGGKVGRALFFHGGCVGRVIFFLSRWMWLDVFLFCAWRIGVVAGVVVPSSWALALLAECGLRRV